MRLCLEAMQTSASFDEIVLDKELDEGEVNTVRAEIYKAVQLLAGDEINDAAAVNRSRDSIEIKIGNNKVGRVLPDWKPDGQEILLYTNTNTKEYTLLFDKEGDLESVRHNDDEGHSNEILWEWIFNDDGQRIGIIVGNGRTHPHLGTGKNSIKIDGWLKTKFNCKK